jgi:two-component system chemotaxis sensor kinase CheA
MQSTPPAGIANDLSSEMAEVIQEFLVESNEGLDRFDRDLIALEKDKTSRELLDSIFRAVHTIKGTGGVLGFEKLVSISHVGESVLSRMRDGVLVLSPEIATTLLAMADSLRRMLENVAVFGNEGDDDFCCVLQKLTDLLQPAAPPSAPATRPPVDEAAHPKLGEILVTSLGCAPEDVHAAVQSQAQGDCRLIGEILVAQGATDPEAVSEGLKVQNDYREIASNTIRVDVALLDKVMNLVGELVLARNQVLQFTDTQEDSTFLSAAQRLNLITTELQEGVMKTRMQPIGNVWSKLPRVVRDMAVACGKRVEVLMEGADTELDKTIIEAIKDPLTHIVRNSIDHGIETPEQRVSNGKPAQGHLVLRAFHEGGQVNIEVSDDGRGVDVDKLKTKAIAKGMVSTEQATRMSERELLNLAFTAGLSTAEQVSNISGRGVGMDVVKTNIEKIGGTIDLQSASGKGTLLKIKIPLTLAIIPALIVSSGAERFAIPQVSLIELVRCEGEQATRGIENVHGAAVYRLRGNLLPLVYLNRELKLASKPNGEAVNIVVLQAGDRQFGLVVDEINDTEEIVVKPLSKQLKSVSCFAGATIMGDGRVALILDVLGLAQMTHVVGQQHEQQATQQAGKSGDGSAARESWLLFRLGKSGRMAIPLSLVSRLEEFNVSQVERFAGHDVIQYRDQIMPLLRLSDALGYSGSTAGELLQVVVTSRQGQTIGLVVDEILDIAEQSAVVQQIGEADKLKGAAVIQQRVTDLLDVPALLAAQHLECAKGARA